jgi:hypothetical protein
MPGRIFETEDEPTREEPPRKGEKVRLWAFFGIGTAFVIIVGLAIYLIRNPIQIEERNLPRLDQGGVSAVFLFVLMVLVAIVLFGIYLLPTFVAAARKHRNLVAILIINLFLGWTLLGWVGALVWAVIVTGPK